MSAQIAEWGRRQLLAAALYATLSPAAWAVTDSHVPERVDNSTQSAQSAQRAYAQNYMAVTANPHATRVAQRILAVGGSAADAAIAAQLVLGLVEPQSSGLGGGAFLLYWDQQRKQLSALDGRERAPRQLPENHFLLPNGEPMAFLDAVIGGHAVGVPGVPALLAELHRRHGRLVWPRLFQDAARLAKRGFDLSPRLHTLLRNTPGIDRHPSLAAWLLDADGEPWPVGHRLRNPEYARTLRALARSGINPFYHGRMGRDIAKAVQRDPIRPGLLSHQDLRRYRVRERIALCGPFRNYRVCGMPPPSSGGSTVLEILGLLDHAERGKWPKTAPDSAAGLHLFAEATRLSFADRNAYIADPDYVEIPMAGMLAPGYLGQRAQLITAKRALRAEEVTAGEPGKRRWQRRPGRSPERPSTTHMTLVDRYGNVLSMTSSIESAFGARLMVRGFLLNNQLSDFSFRPRDSQGVLIANRPAAGKRPRSSMAPTIVFDQRGQPILALGSPGGARIIPYVAQLLWRYLGQAPTRQESENFWKSEQVRVRAVGAEAKARGWNGQPPGTQLPLERAIELPHLVHIGGSLELEEGGKWPVDPEAALRQLGHKPKRRVHNSGIHAVEITPWGIKGVADPRREGLAAGG